MTGLSGSTSALGAPASTARLGFPAVAVSGIGYVVASSTLVSDLAGWLGYGGYFLWPVLVSLALNLLLVWSVATLSGSFPRCGAIYSFTEAVLRPFRAHRLIGLFAAITMLGTTLLAAGGEISSGALSLQQIVGAGVDPRWLVLGLVVAALVPALSGVKVALRVALPVVLLMLGLRWLFGLVGFWGLASTGAWSAQALWSAPTTPIAALRGGLGLAFWGFVGMEAVASLAEETRPGSRVLLHGMSWGLVVVALTSLVLGFGVAGAATASQRSALASSAAACFGDCPQVAVGQAMLGEPGRFAMALASVAACYGTILTGIVAMARLVHGVARDGVQTKGLARVLGRTGPAGEPPKAALVGTAALLSLPAFFARQVVAWILPAALIWVVVYVGYHVLVIVDLTRAKERPRPVRVPFVISLVAALATAAAIPLLFWEVELLGLLARSACVLAGSGLLALALGARPASDVERSRGREAF